MKVSIKREEKAESVRTGLLSSTPFSHFLVTLSCELSPQEQRAFKDGRIDDFEICKSRHYNLRKECDILLHAGSTSEWSSRKESLERLEKNPEIIAARLANDPVIRLSCPDLETAIVATEDAVNGLKALKKRIDERLVIIDEIAALPKNHQETIEL